MIITLSILTSILVILEMFIVAEDAQFVGRCSQCGKMWDGPILIVIFKSMIHQITGCDLGQI